MKATLSNHNQTPRKTRLIVDRIRGKSVKDALAELSFLNKKGTGAIKKLLESAVANARNKGEFGTGDFTIKEVKVDKGMTFKRFFPVSRGRAHPIHKTRSIVTVNLEPTAPVVKSPSSKKSN